MNFNKANKIAIKYLQYLAPHCERIEVAGSLRRKKSDVHDIELICIPKKVFIRDGLFDGSYVPIFEFTEAVNKLERIKGDPERKYCARKLKEGINLDLFICEPENWGYIMAIRTGPMLYSKNIIVKYAKRAGFTLKDGFVFGCSGKVPMPDERSFFRKIGLEWVDPEFRIA